MTTAAMMVDPKYPGTAVQRLTNVHKRVKELADDPRALTGQWEDIRRKILWAGGLKDLPDAQPGQGYTVSKLSSMIYSLCVSVSQPWP